MFASPKNGHDFSTGRSTFKKTLFLLALIFSLFCLYQLIAYKFEQASATTGQIILDNNQISTSTGTHPIYEAIFNYFGNVVYLFPFLFIYICYAVIFSKSKILAIDFFKLGLRILGLNCLIIGLCAVFSSIYNLGVYGAGGILGDFLNILISSFAKGLTPLVSLIIVILALCLFVAKSPWALLENIGAIFSGIYNIIKNKKFSLQYFTVKAKAQSEVQESENTVQEDEIKENIIFESDSNDNSRKEPTFDSKLEDNLNTPPTDSINNTYQRPADILNEPFVAKDEPTNTNSVESVNNYTHNNEQDFVYKNPKKSYSVDDVFDKNNNTQNSFANVNNEQSSTIIYNQDKIVDRKNIDNSNTNIKDSTIIIKDDNIKEDSLDKSKDEINTLIIKADNNKNVNLNSSDLTEKNPYEPMANTNISNNINTTDSLARENDDNQYNLVNASLRNEDNIISFDDKNDGVKVSVAIDGTKNSFIDSVDQNDSHQIKSEKDLDYAYLRATRGVISPKDNENTQEELRNIDNTVNTVNSENTVNDNISSIDKSTSLRANQSDIDNKKYNQTELENNTTINTPNIYEPNNGGMNSNTSNLPSYINNGIKAVVPKVYTSFMVSAPKHHYGPFRPSFDLLTYANRVHTSSSNEEFDAMAGRINNFMKSFGVEAQVERYVKGPVITRYELSLKPGIRSSTISSLSTDLCRSLMVPNVRVIDVIPGSSYVGLEVPNTNREFLNLRDIIECDEFINTKYLLPMCVGCTVTGSPVVIDLAKTPHLLIAGTTGSGKSAGVNSFLVSLLLKRDPSELRLILIDPKRIEFSVYSNLPHLITPVITDVAEKTSAALRWAVEEMERRYSLIELIGLRDLESYNKYIQQAHENGQKVYDPKWTADMGSDVPELDKLPYLVIVVDELADLMQQMAGKKKTEDSPEMLLNRLLAKARAAGIHIILSTQTPRTDIVTGTIKANMPSRISFSVQSGIDSRVILDEFGAEKLLGKGDMLIKGAGSGSVIRAHSGFVSTQDVERVVNAWAEVAGEPEFVQEVIQRDNQDIDDTNGIQSRELDKLFDQAAAFARETYARRQKYPATSDYQATFGVGYPRARKIVMQLKEQGVISE